MQPKPKPQTKKKVVNGVTYNARGRRISPIKPKATTITRGITVSPMKALLPGPMAKKKATSSSKGRNRAV